MANTIQAKKRARQNKKSYTRNKAQRSNVRTLIKEVIKTAEGKDKDAIKSQFQKTVSGIDKLVSKGLIHKNKAARLKSRLNAKVKKAVLA